MIDIKPQRGIEGVLVKLWRGGDYELTVTGRTEITPNFLRLHFTGPELLTERSIHPTMWVRGWFPDGSRSHQRGYTLVNPDPEAGTVDIDFAMHDGVATRWAREAQATQPKWSGASKAAAAGKLQQRDQHPHQPARP